MLAKLLYKEHGFKKVNIALGNFLSTDLLYLKLSTKLHDLFSNSNISIHNFQKQGHPFKC